LCFLKYSRVDEHYDLPQTKVGSLFNRKNQISIFFPPRGSHPLDQATPLTIAETQREKISRLLLHHPKGDLLNSLEISALVVRLPSRIGRRAVWKTKQLN